MSFRIPTLALVLTLLVPALGCGKLRDKILGKEGESSSAARGVEPDEPAPMGSVTFHKDDGGTLIRFEGTMPATFPKDVPIYPAAKLEQAMSDSNGHTLTFHSRDAMPKVAAFYKADAKTGTMTLEVEQADVHLIQYTTSKGHRVSVSITPDEAGSVIMLGALEPEPK